MFIFKSEMLKYRPIKNNITKGLFSKVVVKPTIKHLILVKHPKRVYHPIQVDHPKQESCAEAPLEPKKNAKHVVKIDDSIIITKNVIIS
jgi:hypothetical protein